MSSARALRGLAAALLASSVASVGCAAHDVAPRSADEARVSSSTTAPSVAESSTSRGTPAAAPAAQRANRTGRVLGWVALSIGAEAAIVAGVTSGILVHEKAVRDDACDAARACSPTGLDANSAIASLVGWNAGAWIVALAGVGTGAALLLTHPTDSAPATAVTLAPSPGLTGATLGLRSAF